MFKKLQEKLCTWFSGEPSKTQTKEKEKIVTQVSEKIQSDVQKPDYDYAWEGLEKSIPSIRNLINAISKDITELKKKIRAPHHMMTYAEWEQLQALKARVTLFVVLRAHQRGRLHFPDMDREGQEQWLQMFFSWTDRKLLVR